MTEQYQSTENVVHNLPSDDYRSAPGDSASFLKACLRSVAHAKTPKKKTKALDDGLKIHEYILERAQFEKKYKCGPNPEDYPDIIWTAEDMRALIKKTNESRKPKLKTTGSKEVLLGILAEDDPQHLANVSNIESLKPGDVKDRIKFINEQPNRGLLAANGTIREMARRLRDAGANVKCWDDVVAEHQPPEGVEMLPYEDYAMYDGMYQSLLKHLEEGAEIERQSEEGVLMQWLLYGFTQSNAMRTEVSVFSERDKCRFDALIESGDLRLGLDVKSAANASQDDFARYAARLHYDLQDQHYTQAAADAGIPLTAFVFIAIEKEAPYGVGVYVLDDDAKESGRLKREYAKNKLTAVKQSGIVSAYEPAVKALPLPTWNNFGPWAE